MQPSGFQPTGFQPGPLSSGVTTITLNVDTAYLRVTAGDITFTAPAVIPSKPPGGDDAFQAHPGVAPRLVKSKKREARPEIEDLERLYDVVMGLVPDEPTPAVQKALEAAQEAIAPHADVEVAEALPPASTVDFEALVADLEAVIALKAAYERMLEEDDEDAVFALLLAA